MGTSGTTTGGGRGEAGHTAKVCIRCGRDCSTRPRKKDQQGRYHCQECLDQVRPIAPPHATPSPLPTPAPTQEPAVIELDESTLPAPAADSLDANSRPCPICGRALARTDVLCTECGYNAQTGQRLTPAGRRKAAKEDAAKRGPKCAECGYSLAGIVSGRCPECGHVQGSRGAWRGQDRQQQRAMTRMEYLKPVIMFMVANTIAAITILARGGHPADFANYMLKIAIEVPVGAAVFWVCCLFWIGFDAPVHLTALRLAGIYAVVSAIAIFTAFFAILPVYGIILAWGIPFAVYVGLISEMLEVDLPDAVAVGVITFLLKFLMIVVVFIYLF